MTHDETKRIFDELDDLLDAERTALLTGRIEEVGRLAREAGWKAVFHRTDKAAADVVVGVAELSGVSL